MSTGKQISDDSTREASVSDEPTPDESIREAVERSRSGAPAAGAVVRDRFSSDEIFHRIVAAADEEISTGTRELFFSALAAGFAITLTFMLYASVTDATGGAPVLSAILYPLGFIYIILGDYQLYTENTLPPVALVLERLASIPALLTVWTIVLIGNLVGGTLGAFILASTGVFSPDVMATAVGIAESGVATSWWSLFFKAVFAGLIVAGVVWLDYAAQDTTSRLLMIYLAFLAIPLGNLYHVVVSATEAMFLVFRGDLALATGVFEFVLPVLLGNTIGGILLVTVVNYFQAVERTYQEQNYQLSMREMIFGKYVGGDYVPLPESNDD
ncbi:Formate/nitrite transporter FocA, FNT family [Natronorubrum thiooxidans]|uniref:Formate/nitrite transporter FocA, FNT family n=1 Tax=Natronorubrum thiooxidans TaxID=308853 RepID=A0A1N7GXQ7_9EURY|nr:Formate/nitrite transporter FocA, FNT family [Natronorubrum thiooxidans]